MEAFDTSSNNEEGGRILENYSSLMARMPTQGPSPNHDGDVSKTLQ
jgi:hypothetical protein